MTYSLEMIAALENVTNTIYIEMVHQLENDNVDPQVRLSVLRELIKLDTQLVNRQIKLGRYA